MLEAVKAILLSEEQKKNDYVMLTRLVSLFLHSAFDGMKLEICEFLKGLLDPESKDLKDEFFDLFYTKLLPQLVDYLANTPEDMFTSSLVLEILTCCGNTHGYRIRYYVTHNGVIQRIQSLYYSPQKSIRLSMLRLLRSLISQNDENLNKYIVKHDLFAPVFKLMQGNRRDNMISAAVLEILNVVATQTIKTLIAYVMDKYKQFVVEGQYARHAVMRKLKTKYELFPPSGAVKREIPVGKRVFLNYPTGGEEGKSRGMGEPEQKMAQKRPTSEVPEGKVPISEESPAKKKKEGDDFGGT